MDEGRYIWGLGYEGQQLVQKSKQKGDHDFGQCSLTWGFLWSIWAISWLFNTNLEQFNLAFSTTQCHQCSVLLDQGIATSFKLNYKSKLLQWVLLQYGVSSKQDLRRIAPNIKQALIWCHKIWIEMDPQNIRNSWRMSKILPLSWSANFAFEDEREKHRL